MNRKEVLHELLIETERLRNRIVVAIDAVGEDEYHYNGVREVSAVKRASLDLNQVGVKLRRGNKSTF